MNIKLTTFLCPTETKLGAVERKQKWRQRIPGQLGFLIPLAGCQKEMTFRVTGGALC